MAKSRLAKKGFGELHTTVKDIDSLIRAGQFTKARRLVKDVDGSEIVDQRLFATWIENLRRLGYYDLALWQISRRADEAHWILEKAMILGELGATRSALRLLYLNSPPTERRALAQYHYHCGNLSSIEHNYEKALFHLEERKKLFSNSEYDFAITELNILGTEVNLNVSIGLQNRLPTLRDQLDNYIGLHKKAHPHLALGAFYFRAEIDRAQGRYARALRDLKSALEVFQHKDRESLMFLLLLVELEVHLGRSSEKRLNQVKKKVLAQSHVTYWDQWNFIRGLFHSTKNELQRAQTFWNRVIIGNRTNHHVQRAYQECDCGKVLLRIEAKATSIVTENLIRRYRLHPSDLPALILSNREKVNLFMELPRLISAFSIQIATRGEFGSLMAETWDEVWDQIYTESSRLAFKKLLHRWRNSAPAKTAIISFSGSKLKWIWKSEAKMILEILPPDFSRRKWVSPPF